MKKAVLQSTAALVLIQGSGIMLSYAVTVKLARLLGPVEFGVYSFVIALSAALAIPAQAGLPLLVVREVSQAKRSRNWALIVGLLRWAHGTVLGMSAVIISSAMLLFQIVPTTRGPASLSALLIGLTLLPVVGFSTIRGAIIRGLSFVALSQVSERIIKPVALLMLLFGAAELGRRFGASGALFMTLCAAVISLFAVLLIYKAVRQMELSQFRPEFRMRKWWSSAVPFSLSSGADILNASIGLILLGYFAGPEQVGVYRIGAQFALLAGLVYTTANYVLVPRFSRAFGSERDSLIEQTASITAALSAAAAFFLFVVFALFGGWILEGLFGSAYRIAYVPTLILIMGQIIPAMFGFGIAMLNMSGNERIVTRVFIVGLMINIGITAILVQSLGSIGAALGSTFTVLLMNAWLWWAAKQRLNVNTAIWTVFMLERAGRADEPGCT